MAKDLDELLESLGSRHSPYQKWMIALVIIPTSFFVAVTENLLLFQMAVPDHWCHTPGRENTLHSEEEWKNLTLPTRESGKLSSCFQYKVEWKEEEEKEGELSYIIHNETQACASSWDHNTSEFLTTMATSHDWFCERKDYSNFIYSIKMAGSAVGTLVLPVLSDKYTGRRVMFFITLILHLVFTLPVIWLPYYTAHVILRFISGLAVETNFQMPYLIVLELVSPDKRAMVGCISFVAWTAGMCTTSLVAWLIPRWNYLAFISCIPHAIGFLYWRYLPESPRWLLAKGKISQCADVLMKIAAVNKKSISSRSDLEMELVLLKNQQKEDLSLTHALRYTKLRNRTIILHLLFLACYLSYGIVLLSINILSSNFFLSHFVLSLFELPSNILGWCLTHYLGRRFTLFSTVFLTGVFSVAACFCLHDKWALLTIVGFIKLFSTQLIYIMLVMSTEILPTPVRATGLAWMTVFGLLAMTVGPYALTSGLGESFPYLLIASLMVMSLFLSWPLPETIGLHLPQTFHDAENLGTGRPLKTWIHHWNSTEYPTHPITESPMESELVEMKSDINRESNL